MDEVLQQRDAVCNFVLTRSTGQTIMDDAMPASPPQIAFLVSEDDVVDVGGILF